MSLSRQQKRALIRRLNDPGKMSKVIKRHENAQKRESEIFKKSKTRKLALIFIGALAAFITALIVFG